MARPRGPMDKASDFESEDCGFDPHRGHFYFLSFIKYIFHTNKLSCYHKSIYLFDRNNMFLLITNRKLAEIKYKK